MAIASTPTVWVKGARVGFSIDTALMKAQINDIIDSFSAMAATVQAAGQGQVLTSRRKKERWETKKPLHGSAIANILRMLGKEVFDYDPPVETSVRDMIRDEIVRALQIAYDTVTDQKDIIRAALRRAADTLAQNAVDRLTKGRVGANTGRTRDRKKRLARSGFAESKYGIPPPFGIETGRFVDGIKGGWKSTRPRGR